MSDVILYKCSSKWVPSLQMCARLFSIVVLFSCSSASSENPMLAS